MRLEHLDLGAVLEQVGKERNIDKNVLISALEEAMLSAARKKLGVEADLEARYNEEAGEVEVFEFKRIVDDNVAPKLGEIKFSDAIKLDPDLTKEALGEDLGVKLESREFGRIAAQNAKQIIIQRVREAERMMIYNEYKDRKDEIVAGTVRRFERGNIIVDLGRAEAVVPTSEQVAKENVRINDRIVAYVLDVLEHSKGAQIILSRTHPSLVIKLFEQEVPEIADGVVTIEGAAREPGFRTKISVRSKDSDVDPVGACVGMKGSRVQAVVQELKGEKIDIVPFDMDDARFVCNAIAPAEVTRVLINEEERSMKIVVPDDQYSLAIGRKGQNVRLASQLTGWRIDVDSESTVLADKDQAWIALSQVKSLSEIQFQTLFNHNIKSLSDILQTDDSILVQMPGFNDVDPAAFKQEIRALIKEQEQRKNKEQESYVLEAKSLLVLDDLINDLKAQNKFEELLSLPTLNLTKDEIESLQNIGYFDLTDIYVEKNLSLIESALNMDKQKSQELKDNVYKKLSSLKSDLSFI